MNKKYILLSLLLLSFLGFVQKKITINSIEFEKEALAFFVIGDWGRNGDYNQLEVANAMKKTAQKFEPGFIISTGDNFYSDGVASTLDPQWSKSFEDIYTGADLQKNWYVVLGNHDYHGNPQAQIDYSKISRRWNMPSRYFTTVSKLKSGKKVRFIYIDTNPYVKKYYKESEKYSDLTKQDTTAQTRWIDSVLRNATEEWKIVVGHHPVYSSSAKHGSTQELIDGLKPKMEKHGVQAYFCGHDHDLQHNKPKNSTIDYFLSGAGSEIRYELSSFDYTLFAKPIPGFALVTIKDNVFKLYYIDKDLNVVYSYTRTL